MKNILPSQTIQRCAALLLAILAAACGGEGDEPAFDAARFPASLSLAHHLPAALARAETRLVDFGGPGGRAYLGDGWAADETSEEGTTYTWGVGEESSLSFVLLAPHKVRLTFACWPFRWKEAPRQYVTVVLNGREVDTVRIRSGMREYHLSLPASATVRGRNELRFRYAYAESPMGVDPAAQDPRTLAVAWDFLRFGEAPEAPRSVEPAASGDTLFVPFSSEVSFFLELPGTSYLTFDGFDSDRWRGRLAVRARLDNDGDGAGVAVERTLRATDRRLVVGIETEEPRLAQITLTALDGGSSPAAGRGLRLRRPTLHSARAIAEAAPAPPAASSGGAARRVPVIFYLVDTLRADHLGCYGYEKPVSPNIDAFAADAALFEHTLAQASWTRSTVASVFTGLIPTSHGVHSRLDALSEDAETLAEILRREGYGTSAFVTNGNVGEEFGFAQGFDTFSLLAGTDEDSLHFPADAINRKVSAWLEQRGETPFFLYVHTMEPHAPYAPAADAAARFARDVEEPELSAQSKAALDALTQQFQGRFRRAQKAKLGSVPWMQALDRQLIPVTPAMTEDLTALYDAEIHANDRGFGAFVEGLKRAGLYEDALIVFLSDHGEELYDHQGWNHGHTLFQEMVRVPLIVKLPGAGRPRGLRISGLGQQIDLLPTVLDLLGLPRPAHLQGASLLPLIDGGTAAAARPGFAHLDLDNTRYVSLVEGPWKLICAGFAADVCQLFDLDADPAETADLAASRPVLTGYLQSRLRVWENGGYKLVADEAEIDPELRERLQALGYVQ